MIISLIAAMDRNRLIGNNNALPWHLPADFAHFKQLTMGKPILMGHKTFDSIGKPLPGRNNIVLSRSSGLDIEGVTVVNNVEQALQAAGTAEELMVIGGSAVYKMLLPTAQRMYLTEVDAEFEGDAWFPEFDASQWRQAASKQRAADGNNPYSCRFVTYERKI